MKNPSSAAARLDPAPIARSSRCSPTISASCPGTRTDGAGKPRGSIGSGAMRTLIGEILVKRPERSRRSTKEMTWAAQGVTTWSSSSDGENLRRLRRSRSGRRYADPLPVARMGRRVFAGGEFYSTPGNIAGGTDFLVRKSRCLPWTAAIRATATVEAPANTKAQKYADAEFKISARRSSPIGAHSGHVFAD